MQLSKRLQAIADFIPNKSHVIDVGCDHGLLSIYLSIHKNCSCIAADIRESALGNALKNIEKYDAHNIQTIVTDGIDNITISFDDYIVISGMGTYTIMHILENKELSNHLIISSQNHIKELRKFLVSIGYVIDNESFVVERDKEYIILVLSKGNVSYSDFEYEYGPILLKNTEYITRTINNKKAILSKIPIQKDKVRNKIELEITKLKQEL